MRQNGRLVLAVAALASAACAVSQDQEVAIGRQNAEEINAKLPIVRDPVVSEYVQQLGLSIAKGTPRSDLDIVRRHSVQQMEKGTKANVAVGLTCTLTRLCNSDVARTAIQVGGAALFARYSRRDEAEADSEAVLNVVQAGLDPHGIPVLFERLLEERRTSPLRIEAFFASHPLEEDRIRATQREIGMLDQEMLRGLRRDDPSYAAFRERLLALPASPEPRPGTQLDLREVRP